MNIPFDGMAHFSLNLFKNKKSTQSLDFSYIRAIIAFKSNRTKKLIRKHEFTFVESCRSRPSGLCSSSVVEEKGKARANLYYCAIR